MTQKSREELSAEWQVKQPDFCGVDMKAHNAYLAGFDAATARLQNENEELFQSLESTREMIHNDLCGHMFHHEKCQQLRIVIAKYPGVKE